MKLVRFEFDCASQQPWYGHLCNQYLNYDKLNITVALLPLKSAAKQSAATALEHNHQAPRILWRYILEAREARVSLSSSPMRLRVIFS